MTELKKKIEALLFSSGRKMDIEEISRLCKSNPEEVKNILTGLKEEYEENKSSLMVVDEGNSWKITVREQYLPLVQNIVTQTELSKTLMGTLAVIAFKYPIKQSDLIKIRTNKAYDHLKELEEIGYITRQKYGRTKLIKLTQKFFDYFDLPPEKLKEKFETFEGIAKAIENKENEIKKMKEEQKRKLEEAKKKEEEAKKEPEIDLIDEKGHKEKLNVYEEPKEKPKIEVVKEKLGKLEVVDEPEETEEIEEKPEETEETEEEPEEETTAEEPEDEEKVQKIVKEILSEDEEKEKQIEEKSEVDKKVEEILTGKKEEVEESAETKKEAGEEKEEPKNILEAEQEKKEKKEEAEEQEKE